MTDSADNLLQMERRPNWYDHLPQVEAAMAEADRIYWIRDSAGWEADEGGWYSPCGIPEHDWYLDGRPFPEDPGYAEFASAFYHYEEVDNGPN